VAAIGVSVFVALPVSADSVNVFQIGSTHPGSCSANAALDPNNNCITGSATPTWVNNFSGGPGTKATLTIVAEGIDNGSVIPGGEKDGVFVNGTFVGFLTQQNFYSPLFNLSNSNAITGPKDLDGDDADPTVVGQPSSAQITDLSISTFDVTGLVLCAPVHGSETAEVLFGLVPEGHCTDRTVARYIRGPIDCDSIAPSQTRRACRSAACRQTLYRTGDDSAPGDALGAGSSGQTR
jgi:hypothetical protein